MGKSTLGQFKHIFGFLLLFCIYSHQSFCTVLINELLTSTAQQDDEGNALEWIELYNTGDEDVNLGGYVLRDNGNTWVFPDVTISANGFITVYTTGLDQQIGQQFHTNFSLKNEGENVTLFNPQFELIDQIEYPQQRRDVSYGRQLNSNSKWGYFTSPTQNNSNNTEFYIGIAEPPHVSYRAGVYSNPIQLEISSSHDDAEIRYTTDGSAPDANSTLYQSPIEIISAQPIRAQVRIPGFVPSVVITNSYIIRHHANP